MSGYDHAKSLARQRLLAFNVPPLPHSDSDSSTEWFVEKLEQPRLAYAVGSVFVAILLCTFTFDLFAFQQATRILFITFGLLWCNYSLPSNPAEIPSVVDAALYAVMLLGKKRGFQIALAWVRGESSRSSRYPELSAHTASGLRIDRVDSVEDLDSFREEWDGFVEQSGSDIYFTVDWLQSWWKHYGQRWVFHGVIVRDNARMVGALPFCVQRVWAGPVPVRLAKFVGADSTLPVFTPAIAEGFEQQVMRVALESLLDNAGCDAVSLSPLSGLSRVPEAVGQATASDGFRLVRSDSPGVHTVFRLPGSFEEYLQGLSSSQRQIHRRFLRKLKSQYEITFRTVSRDEAIAYFDRFAELHAAYWHERGKLGHFGDWPAGAEFNRDLVSRMAASGRARFYEIAGDGRVLAMEYCFVLGDRCYWRLPARDPDPRLEELRLGRLSLAEMFRVLIETGQRVVEGGPAHYDYKLRLGAEEHPLRRIIVSRQARPPRWRAALLVRWADLVHFAYYRGWFLKLRPKLGLPPRPLGRLYIRTRI